MECLHPRLEQPRVRPPAFCPHFLEPNRASGDVSDDAVLAGGQGNHQVSAKASSGADVHRHPMNRSPIAGKTLLFTFEDGPMAGKTFEHFFEPSGSVRYRQVDSKGEGTSEKKYEGALVGQDVCAISYLGSSGYTLTVVLDYRTKRLVAFS
jgi:hypothetical protein